jgi:phosphoribosylformimino-5-aminoimidazole carboxamide ribonucleotide (ProFAR) isomerase
VESIIYTDIGRDGMMGGVNIEATVKLAQAVKIPVIASGGLHNMGDVEALCAVRTKASKASSAAAPSTKARSTWPAARIAPMN